MNKFLSKLWKIVKVGACIAGGFLLVSAYPPVAIGFAGVYAAKYAKSEYSKVIAATAAAVLFAMLMANFAELAVLAVMFPIADYVNEWQTHVEAA